MSELALIPESTQNVEAVKSDVELMLNQRYFITGIICLTDLVLNKLNSLEVKSEAHIKCIATCNDIIKQYKTDTEKYDQSRIIKKVFTTLRDFGDELISDDESLFSKRNKENKIVTIIPGLNISLVYSLLDDEDKTKLWSYLKLMFVTSSKMIFSVAKNKRKQSEKLINFIKKCEEYVINSKLPVSSFLFNPFLGVDGGELTADEIMERASQIKLESSGGLLDMLSISNLLDMDELKKQLESIDEAQIERVSETLSTLFGSKDDKDVNDISKKLLTAVVDDLKTNGFNDMTNIFDRVGEKIKGQVDMEKMKKVRKQFGKIIEKDMKNLPIFKDKDGNPIDMDSLNQNNITPSMIANIFSSITQMVGNNMGKTETDKSSEKDKSTKTETEKSTKTETEKSTKTETEKSTRTEPEKSNKSKKSDDVKLLKNKKKVKKN